ncbi:hypothetical protein C5L38_23115 [Streptomyces sp. WAC00288]|uniref:DUF6243 family protein n=1 Tax=unclassified Streptomyces TaxID=2593676 RepID=UPI0007897051|nr:MULTISPECIES: DUF6243 family protein [unclassified Streptomyces]AVH97591.1 hypothetical protein C5L38_23115 [Streptomyces sp. WAC00288]KYG56189.1 hypothetical protein AWI43_18765 [Streptomyces sp. WAC04657]
MAKSRNNLLGVGGQRKKLSRADQQATTRDRAADRRTADEQKQELLRKMRDRAQGAEAPDTASETPEAASDTSDSASDAPDAASEVAGRE